jgi:hypothetical protein
MRKLELHWQILIAIVLAGVVGGFVFNAKSATGVDPTLFGIKYLSIFDYVGTIFLNALKMIIVPLIMSSIIVGVAGIGSGGNLGALGGKTLLFYAATTLAAIMVGLVLINAVGPGYVNGEPARDLLALEASTADLEQSVAGKGPGDVAKIFQRMVPPNIVKAAVEGQMLGIIFFAILFGYFMTQLDNQYAEPLYRFWDAVFHVMMRMTEWIMKFAPIGVFGLVAAVIAKAGYKATGPLAVFAIVVLVDGIFDGILIGNPAGNDGLRRGQYRRLQQGLEFRIAAGGHREHERDGPVRVRGGDVHRTGLRTGADVRRAVLDRGDRVADIDRRGRCTVGLAGGDCDYPDGDRAADRGAGRAVGIRPDPRHGEDQHQRLGRLQLRDDRGTPRGGEDQRGGGFREYLIAVIASCKARGNLRSLRPSGSR